MLCHDYNCRLNRENRRGIMLDARQSPRISDNRMPLFAIRRCYERQNRDTRLLGARGLFLQLRASVTRHCTGC